MKVVRASDQHIIPPQEQGTCVLVGIGAADYSRKGVCRCVGQGTSEGQSYRCKMTSVELLSPEPLNLQANEGAETE